MIKKKKENTKHDLTGQCDLSVFSLKKSASAHVGKDRLIPAGARRYVKIREGHEKSCHPRFVRATSSGRKPLTAHEKHHHWNSL